MPWVRLDDRFPSHRKVALLSDRAFRLYVSALCWSSEQLTEGRILARELPVITRVRGAKAAAKELEDAGLWDRTDDGWAIHDYLEYNPDRARVQADRAANASRQQAWRDRKKAQREATRNASRNGVTHDAGNGSDNTNSTATRHDSDMDTRDVNFANPQSSQVNGFRNGVSNRTPVPSPSPSVPPTEVLTDCEPDTPPLPMIGDRPRIPTAAKPLVDAITSNRMVVGWDLAPAEWILIEALIKRVGIPALVDDAAASWQNARSRPRSGKYFLPAWRKLPDVLDAQSNPDAFLPAVHAGPPSKHTAYLADMAAIADELRHAGGAS